ncbi:MAG TPA: biotin-dependent carboxyltransferase [Campylobacterales bacterium]|nr:biotin-dependent carboxyltransferase [Campylobacterales bacterium]
MAFEILQPGLFTTIQDLGRLGYADRGRTNSGAMDEYAYRWAQKLLGNQNSNALEVMSGLKLKVTETRQIAVTGADLTFTINGRHVPIWQIHTVQAGDILFFQRRVSGQRAYLAVRGGFNAQKVYGSYATTLKEGIGSRLQKSDSLGSESFSLTKYGTKVTDSYIPTYSDNVTLRVLLSYQENSFREEEKIKFFSSEYEVTPQSNRMGYRLRGTPIVPTSDRLISEGIALGSIQVPKDGQPIILLKERQTIGGYPKIGTVLPIDCFRLAQIPIGGKVRFEPMSIEEGQAKMRLFYKMFS